MLWDVDGARSFQLTAVDVLHEHIVNVPLGKFLMLHGPKEVPLRTQGTRQIEVVALGPLQGDCHASFKLHQSFRRWRLTSKGPSNPRDPRSRPSAELGHGHTPDAIRLTTLQRMEVRPC